jgi:hypothetical protein
MVGSDPAMMDAYTMVGRNHVQILSSDKDTQVAQYLPTTRKYIPDWVIQLLDVIKKELR